MEEEGLLDKLGVAPKRPPDGAAFLELVLAREADQDKDGRVVQPELVSLQLKATEYKAKEVGRDLGVYTSWAQVRLHAQGRGAEPPETLAELVYAVFCGFDRTWVADRAAVSGAVVLAGYRLSVQAFCATIKLAAGSWCASRSSARAPRPS